MKEEGEEVVGRVSGRRRRRGRKWRLFGGRDKSEGKLEVEKREGGCWWQRRRRRRVLVAKEEEEGVGAEEEKE